MKNGVVQFGERFPARVDRDAFASNLLVAATALVADVELSLSVAAITFTGQCSRLVELGVPNQYVELVWQVGDSLVFARLHQNGRPYAIAWVEYEG